MKKKLIAILWCAVMLCTPVLVPVEADAGSGGSEGQMMYLSDFPDDRILGISSLLDNTVSNDGAPVDGTPIHIGSKGYAKGIGMHCNAENPTYAEYDIDGMGAVIFYAEVGVQNVSDTGEFLGFGDIVFYVEVDGVEVYRSPVKKCDEEATVIELDISGAKTLRLGQDNNGGHPCDWGVWGNAAVCDSEALPPTAPPEDTEPPETMPMPDTLEKGYAFVSDLTWTDDRGHPDAPNCRDTNIKGEALWSSDLWLYSKGIGMHCRDNDFGSYVELDIAEYGFTEFTADVGVCVTLTGYNSMASIQFAVYGDGQELWRSETLRHFDPYERVSVNVEGVRTLRLAVSGVDGISGDWAAWGNALLSRNTDVSDLFVPDGVLIYDANAEIEKWEQETGVESGAETEPTTATVPVTETETEPGTTADAESVPTVTGTITDDHTEMDTSEVSGSDGGKGCAAGLTAATSLVTLAGTAGAFILHKREDEDGRGGGAS